MPLSALATDATLVLAGHPDLRLTVLLRHDGDPVRPVEVVLVLDDEPVEWLVDPGLLNAGLRAPVGQDGVWVQVVEHAVQVTVGALALRLPLPAVVALLSRCRAAGPALTPV